MRDFCELVPPPPYASPSSPFALLPGGGAAATFVECAVRCLTYRSCSSLVPWRWRCRDVASHHSRLSPSLSLFLSLARLRLILCMQLPRRSWAGESGTRVGEFSRVVSAVAAVAEQIECAHGPPAHQQAGMRYFCAAHDPRVCMQAGESYAPHARTHAPRVLPHPLLSPRYQVGQAGRLAKDTHSSRSAGLTH